jgi:hypothetical protein
MHHILDRPAEGGLGLRRCQWFTTTLNIPSQRAALRLGFTHEGNLRNYIVLPKGKVGIRGESGLPICRAGRAGYPLASSFCLADIVQKGERATPSPDKCPEIVGLRASHGENGRTVSESD